MLLTTSARELSKLELIQHVCDKRIRQIDATQALKLSRRQIQRLVNFFREFGPQVLISKKRTRPGNHQYCSLLKSQVLELIQTHYHDFGPTLISEKLSEVHNITLSNETIRQWLIYNLWKPKQKKRRKVYQPRCTA
ncbi:hypothetical protein [Vibrio mediterranei]|jgi:hypothetical protein|uniref:hypothetical protein n=1 Tax=Vibrio mediterranei TaxID=689 RepID=UPI0022841109|nr:hypothetical protein [Vibrio mediterranei]MCY9855661.1 hypothetical protein [Vibrio mediterranei]